VVDGQAVYTGFADGVLTAIQIDTGELLWATDLGDDSPEFTDVDLPVILDGERMFAASYAGGIHSVSREDGAIEWRIPIEAVSQMTLAQGVLYAVSAQGRVVAIDTETRKQVWGFRYASDTPVGVSVRGPYVFVATSAGPMHVLDSATGYPLARWNPSHGFNNAPTFEGARAWALSNGGYLYGVEVSRGAPRASR
jgi:outer membrane protein assembly factor BamB